MDTHSLYDFARESRPFWICNSSSKLITDRGTELEVEAGTTGYRGTPCRKAGGRTYLRLECWAGDFHFETISDEDGAPIGVEIACCGDAGLNAVMKALDFAREVINDQRCEVDD